MGGVEEPKNIILPALPPFSGADPVPKDEASCEQWVWQAKEALKSSTAGTVRIAIVQSIRGEVREFAAAAVGFKASVEMVLEKIEDCFGEKWTTGGLQQDFYKITQGKNEKVRQFAGRLEAQFRWLKEKVPGRYDSNTLKEKFFHGMHQHFKDSIQFCYKQEDMTYEELFHEMVEAEEKVPEVKITSLKAKSAIAGEDSTGIQDLKWKIDALTTVVKSSTFGGDRPKQSRNGTTPEKGKDNGKKMEAHTKDRAWQQHLLDHLSQDRSTSSVIIVVGGDIVVSSVPARGHQLEGLKWG